MRRLLATVVLSLTMSAAMAAPPAFVAADVPDARLAGEGEYTWFGMRIYRAQLWVGANGYQGAASETAPFVLELRLKKPLKIIKTVCLTYILKT